MHNGVADSELFPPGYQVFRSDRPTRGGGVLIAVKDTYSCTSINLVSPIPECELVAASISFGKQKITLLSVYLPPGLTCNSYLQLFEHLELNLNFSHPVIIAGDFNIPEYVNCLDGNKSSYVFDNICHFISIANLSQQNAVLNHNLRLLDLILSNDHITVKVSRHESALVSEDPHHPCLKLDILLKGMEFRFVENPNSVSFNFRKANLEELYLLLANTDWSKIEEFSDPDSACNYFYNTLHEKFVQTVPLRKGNSKRSDYPIWFTKLIINMIKQKRHHWSRYRKSGLLYHLDKFEELKKKLKVKYKEHITDLY